MIDTRKKLKESKLSVADLLLLFEYNGRTKDYRISEYKIEEYGFDYLERIQNLIANGYLKFGSPEESLQALTIVQLKEILRANKQKLSGNKNELINRVVQNIPAKNYADNLPKIYNATQKGILEIEHRSAYIENRQEMYGFLNSEILAVEDSLDRQDMNSAEEILEQLFSRAIVKHSIAHNFGLLRNAYYNMHKFYKKRGKLKDSLSALLAAIYIDLSGMSNNNTVNQYNSLGFVFETSLWQEIDKERTALNLSDNDLISMFYATVDILDKLPFSYFSVDKMAEIIIDRLHGQMNLLEQYEKYADYPSEDNPNYNYYDLSSYKIEYLSEIEKLPLENNKIDKNAGCMILFFILFLAIFEIMMHW